MFGLGGQWQRGQAADHGPPVNEHSTLPGLLVNYYQGRGEVKAAQAEPVRAMAWGLVNARVNGQPWMKWERELPDAYRRNEAEALAKEFLRQMDSADLQGLRAEVMAYFGLPAHHESDAWIFSPLGDDEYLQLTKALTLWAFQVDVREELGRAPNAELETIHEESKRLATDHPSGF